VSDHFLFFPGDSYPSDDHVRRAIEEHLGISLTLLEDGRPNRVADRVAMLRQVMNEAPWQRFVLIGRSSGARVVTEIAANPELSGQVDAVIALAYPFRRPDRPDDPARTAHLRAVRAPCLIVQGVDDEYGGEDAFSTYPMSAAVVCKTVEAAHTFRLDRERWAALAPAMGAFLSNTIPARHWAAA